VNAGTIERKLSEQQEIPIPTAFLIVFLTDQASARNLPVMFPDQSNYPASDCRLDNTHRVWYLASNNLTKAPLRPVLSRRIARV
jgi:hypothetical protein